MAHLLYRCYLYFVTLALLVFAAVAAAQLFQVLLALTPLRGAFGNRPGNQTVMQAVVFAAVTWLIAGVLGGVHYWLIRRDMRRDPAAGGSAIRAFFLNMAELIVAPTAIGVVAFGVLIQLGHTPASDVSFASATAIVLLCLFGVLEWERQRARAAPGVATAFQWLHLYGVQAILLIQFIIAWLDMGRWLLDSIIFSGRALGVAPCGGFTGCPAVNLLSLTASTLWLLLCWIGYGFLSRHEATSRLRQMLHFASFASGALFLFMGAATAFDLLLKLGLRVPISAQEIVTPTQTPDFVSSLTLGLLIMGVYASWLRLSAGQQSERRTTTRLIALAILTTLLAAWFWWGVGSVVLYTLESLLPGETMPQARDWAAALASLIVGLASLPLAFFLRRWKRRAPALAGPAWRGFLLALLGGGILAVAVGSAVALYALGTTLLSVPLTHWVHTAHVGLAAVVTGAVVAGISLWRAQQEQLFKEQRAGSGGLQPAQASEPEHSIEAVIDDLLAQRMTREAALERLRMLCTVPLKEQQSGAGASSDHVRTSR